MSDNKQYPSNTVVSWWMRNHTNFPKHFDAIVREYKKQQAITLAQKIKEKYNNENDE